MLLAICSLLWEQKEVRQDLVDNVSAMHKSEQEELQHQASGQESRLSEQISFCESATEMQVQMSICKR